MKRTLLYSKEGSITRLKKCWTTLPARYLVVRFYYICWILFVNAKTAGAEEVYIIPGYAIILADLAGIIALAVYVARTL